MLGNWGTHWREGFLRAVRQPELAQPLREASLRGQLGRWTEALTAAAVRACEMLGWSAAAKGHVLHRLPVPHHEYLGLDVMAFRDQAGRWPFPVAAIELENSNSDDRIAYSLWKVMCVRADLRLVFGYRREQSEAAGLVHRCCKQVVGSMTIEDRLALPGETLMVVGSRGDADVFPYGFFSWWVLDKNTGSFDLL